MEGKSVKLVALGIVLVLLASGIGTVSAFSNSGDGDWKYYKELTVKENSGKTLTDYQVLVELNPSNFPANAKSDGSDLRFEDASGKELSYWIEEWNAGAKRAKIWVRVPFIPANGEAKIKMYYGNPSASAVSDGDKVFEFFDDFEGTSLETSKWIEAYAGGTYSVSSGMLNMHGIAGGDEIIACTDGWSPPIIMRYKSYTSRTDSHDAIIGFYYTNIGIAGDWQGAKGNAFAIYYKRNHAVVGDGTNYAQRNLDISDAWHTFEMRRTGSVTEFYIDDIYQTTLDQDVIGIRYPRFFARNTHLKIDWIFIRKYASIEPTLTLSAEYPTTAPTPTPPTSPSGKLKAVWLYNPDKYDTSTLMTDLKSTGIDTIFMSTDVNNIWKYERFVKSAHENGIEVHAMILEDPRCALKENHASSIKAVETVLDYNDKSLAKFDGINIDTEPYVDLDLEQVWQDYITLLETIHEKTTGKTVLSADIPRWYDETKIKDLASNVDFFAIMAYDSGGAGWNTASEIEDAVASEMGAIRGEGSDAVIGIGVQEGFMDKDAVEKCIEDLYNYYSNDPAFLGVSIFKYESYSNEYTIQPIIITLKRDNRDLYPKKFYLLISNHGEALNDVSVKITPETSGISVKDGYVKYGAISAQESSMGDSYFEIDVTTNTNPLIFSADVKWADSKGSHKKTIQLKITNPDMSSIGPKVSDDLQEILLSEVPGLILQPLIGPSLSFTWFLTEFGEMYYNSYVLCTIDENGEPLKAEVVYADLEWLPYWLVPPQLIKYSKNGIVYWTDADNAFLVVKVVNWDNKNQYVYVDPRAYDKNVRYPEIPIITIAFYSNGETKWLAPPLVSITKEREASPKTVVKIDCPVNATLTDQYDRIISDDGTNEIPNACMVITNETKIFCLPSNFRYSTEIDAYDTGTFNFTRFSPIGNDISITKFENVSVTENTKALVEIEPNVTDYTMSIDYDGDETIDEEKEPVSEVIKVSPEIPTPTPEPLGFEAVFAVAGLLAVAYVLRRKRQ